MSERIEELLIGYILNELSPEESQEIEQLLQQQPELIHKIKELESIWGLMVHDVALFKPSNHLRKRILVNAQSTGVPARRRWSVPQFQWRDGVISALILMLLGLGLDHWRLYNQVAEQNTAIHALKEVQTNVFEMKATPSAQGAFGRVLLDIQSGYAVVLVENLPPLAPGEAYHLWAFTPKTKILCGRFNLRKNAGQANISLLQPHQMKFVQFMRISRENINSTQDPKRKKVLVMTSES